MKIVSWFTIGNGYEKVLYDYLVPSLEKLKLPYKIYAVKGLENWKLNTCLKPKIAKMALEELKDDILLLDADCRVYEEPENIPEGYDVGLFWLDWNEWYKTQSDRNELLSGTMILRYNDKVIKLLNHWQELCDVNKYVDQKNLEFAVEELKNELKIFKLDYPYCWINSLPNGKEPNVTRPKNVKIEHFQHSRTIKKG